MSQTLERGITLLLHLSDIALGQDDPKVALKDIAAAVSLDKATAFRLLKSLGKFQLVETDGKGNYWVGSGALVLAQAASRTNNLIGQAIPIMRELAAFTGETVSLAERRDLSSVTLYEIESAQSVRYANKIGAAAPLHAGAGPRAILAFSEPALVDQVLAGPLEHFNAETITDPLRLEQALRKSRKDGFVVSSGERVGGTNSISVPLCGNDGYARGAMSILWPSRGAAIDRQRMRDWPGKLMSAARNLHVGFKRPAA
ncbi:IclR family transcriptional regulator [Lacisediminimonas sp.]|uniref:IclR family transcriptional regulator n=1 Tax=Lacisediminimonas sp. TaxID=3060582 RepID=UPI00271A9955|nr:IclR family transcriptional regulator [Lacisediminimonas sp.]MDO8301200.1 IclR family transcriptional regulator [Lacisediminimonas sp.]